MREGNSLLKRGSVLGSLVACLPACLSFKREGRLLWFVFLLFFSFIPFVCVDSSDRILVSVL